MNVVVTGASAGIGLGIAKAFADAGHNVWSLSRSSPPDGRIKHIACDISTRENVEKAFEQIERVDILVNNAGIGIGGAGEFTSERDMKEIFDVNFFGAVACSQCVIPKMRAQGGGRIIFISSVGAIFTLPFQSFYSATKTAINSFAEGLAMELEPFNIKVGVILPGDIRSNFTRNRKKDFQGEDIYNGRIARGLATMEKDERNGPPAEGAGRVIAKCITKKRLKLHRVIGMKYKCLCMLDVILPRSVVIWLLSKMYGGN